MVDFLYHEMQYVSPFKDDKINFSKLTDELWCNKMILVLKPQESAKTLFDITLPINRQKQKVASRILRLNFLKCQDMRFSSKYQQIGYKVNTLT